MLRELLPTSRKAFWANPKATQANVKDFVEMRFVKVLRFLDVGLAVPVQGPPIDKQKCLTSRSPVIGYARGAQTSRVPQE